MIFYLSMPTDGMVHPWWGVPGGTFWVCLEKGSDRNTAPGPAAVLPKCPHNTAHGYGSTRAIDPSKNGCKVGQLFVSPATTGQWWLLWRILAERLPGQFDSPAEMVMTSDPALWVKFMKYCWLWHVMAYFKLPQVSEFIIGYDISGTFGKSSGLLLTISKWVKDVNALQKRSMKMWSVSFSISIDAPFNLFQLI